MSDAFLRWPQVKARVPRSKSGIYAAIAEGRFPKPIKISGPSGRAVAWLESEIDAWLRQQVELSRKPAESFAEPAEEPECADSFRGTALHLRQGLGLRRSPSH
jgi:prophage regulatory protein